MITRALAGMLYGVTPSDPVTLAGAVGLVLAVAALATLVPAARAALLQPTRILREEWAGIFNTHFWVDREQEMGVVVMMQLLPFYDEQAMSLLAGVEEIVAATLTEASGVGHRTLLFAVPPASTLAWYA